MNGSAHDYARLTPAEQEVLDEQLAAYALGALSESEVADVARHLAGCAACRQRVAGLASAVALLPLACDEVEPSPGLKGRLLAAAEAERRAAPAPDGPAAPRAWGAASRPPGQPPPPPAAWRERRARPAGGVSWRWALPTAALLLVSIGLGAWSLHLQQEVEGQSDLLARYENARQTWRLAGSGPAAGATATLVEPVSGRPLLVTQALPPLPASEAYQVWVIRDGQPSSAGVFPPGAGGQLLGELDQSLEGASTVAVTVEPAGGSPGPTGPIVLAANL